MCGTFQHNIFISMPHAGVGDGTNHYLLKYSKFYESCTFRNYHLSKVNPSFCVSDF